VWWCSIISGFLGDFAFFCFIVRRQDAGADCGLALRQKVYLGIEKWPILSSPYTRTKPSDLLVKRLMGRQCAACNNFCSNLTAKPENSNTKSNELNVNKSGR